MKTIQKQTWHTCTQCHEDYLHKIRYKTICHECYTNDTTVYQKNFELFKSLLPLVLCIEKNNTPYVKDLKIDRDNMWFSRTAKDHIRFRCTIWCPVQNSDRPIYDMCYRLGDIPAFSGVGAITILDDHTILASAHNVTLTFNVKPS